MTDDATIIEGDPGFLGMASRLNPVNLPPGLCQLVENMRLDRGVAQTRRGALRVATGIALEAAELTVPFQLALDQPIADLTYATGTITATLTAHGYTTGDTINIRGADQPEYNGDFTITVVDANEFTYTPTGSPAVTPATGTLIANAGPLVQTTYSGGIFATGVYSSPRFDQAKEYIVLCAPGAAFLWREGETLRTISYPATDTFQPGDDITVLQAFDKLYLHRDRPATTRRVTAIAVSGTTATASVNAHGLTTGDVVRISNADQLALNGDFAVTVTDPNEFDYTVPTGTPAATITEPVFARPVLPTLVWEGDIAVPTFARVALGVHPTGPTFSRMPAGPIAAYFNNQTVIVRGRDEVLISDVLDAETYDPLLKSFRANVGSNDELVAIHPYAESQALVFGKKSIYLASIAIANDGISIDPAASSLQLLTNEIGCLARRTVATAGVFVFFLSESGVYRLDNQFDLKLRGNTQPLSDPIADLLEDLNQPFAHTSIGLFFGNRYYLAIPTGTSEEPNTILAYNMLNQQWEYRDTFAFKIGNLVVSDFSGRRRLFAANRNGGIFLLDETDTGLDSAQATAETDYQGGRLLTRRFSWGTLNAKRLLRVKSSLVLPPGSSLALDAITTDYDRDFQIATLTNTQAETEDYTLKAPLRTKATYLDIRYRTTAGRPILRNLTAESTRTTMEPTETRTRT
jgi:hypothetical protein